MDVYVNQSPQLPKLAEAPSWQPDPSRWAGGSGAADRAGTPGRPGVRKTAQLW